MDEVRVELLLGTRVLDAEGKNAGRIEEIVTDDPTPAGCLVRELHLGSPALWERMLGSLAALPFFGWAGRKSRGRRVPWDRLDLADPAKPRLTCRVADLELL